MRERERERERENRMREGEQAWDAASRESLGRPSDTSPDPPVSILKVTKRDFTLLPHHVCNGSQAELGPGPQLYT